MLKDTFLRGDSVNKNHLNLEDKWEKRLQGTLFHRLQEEDKKKQKRKNALIFQYITMNT